MAVLFEGSKGPNKELEDKYVEVLGWVTAMVKRGYVADTDHLTLADLSFVSTFSTLKVRKQDFKKSMTASKTDFPKKNLIFQQFLLFLFSFFFHFECILFLKFAFKNPLPFNLKDILAYFTSRWNLSNKY